MPGAGPRPRRWGQPRARASAARRTPLGRHAAMRSVLGGSSLDLAAPLGELALAALGAVRAVDLHCEIIAVAQLAHHCPRGALPTQIGQRARVEAGLSRVMRGHYSRLKLQSPRGHEGLGARLRRLSGGPERGIGSRAPGHLASHAGAVGRRGAAESTTCPTRRLDPRLRRSSKRSSSDALFHRKRGRRKHPFACAHAATRLRPAQAR